MKHQKRLLIILIIIAIYFLSLIEFKVSGIELLVNPKMITSVSPIYPIKIVRETLQSKFVFGDEDLSFWYLTLATKRITEAEVLTSHHLETQAYETVKKAIQYQNLGDSYLKNLIDVIDVNNLQQIRSNNQERINTFLRRISI